MRGITNTKAPKVVLMGATTMRASLPKPTVKGGKHRAIPGLDGYRATRDGHIQSKRPNGQWLDLKATANQYGYLRIKIRGKQRRVHSLMMLAFVGECPRGMEVLHHNDIPGDNRIRNLRYGTKSENALDKQRNKKRKSQRQAFSVRRLFTVNMTESPRQEMP